MLFGPGIDKVRSLAVYGDSGGGGGGTNTTTQVQEIPQFQQDMIQNNENVARSLAAQPYPGASYTGTLVEGLNPTEQVGLNAVTNNAFSSYAPSLAASNTDLNATRAFGMNSVTDPTQNQGYGAAAVGNANPVPTTSQNVNAIQDYSQSLNPNQAGVVASYMNPYVQNSLAPQLLQAGITQAQQQNQINSQATGANAFGDARQGTQNALQNYYGQQTNAGIEAQGLNTAYNSALTTALGEQGVQQQMANTQLGLGQLGTTEQGVMQNQQTLGQNQDKIVQGEQQISNQTAQQQAANAQQSQSQAMTAGNAIYNAGNIQQTNQQAKDNAAYQMFQNQVNWPYQQLNVMESAVNSSPYQIANAVTLPGTNPVTNGLSSFSTLAGGLGALTNGASTNGKIS